MRTVYLGTSQFAVAVLERLARSPHRPVLVVTRPDRPRGRGRRVASPPVAETARALGIELAQPEHVNDPEARGLVAAARPDVVTICEFGALLREPLLSAHEMLNVHPSLLPRWRGAAPVERAIEAGDAVTGVSIMRPTLEMDAGPVCLARAEPIRPDDDYGSLSRRLAELGGELLVEALDGRPACVEQSSEGVTIAPKIEREERRLDPEAASAAALARRVRALTPHVGAWLELSAAAPSHRGGERLGVRAARALHGAQPELAPGELAAAGERLLLGCADGVLELLEVQPAGGRPMEAAAWLRGRGAAAVGVRTAPDAAPTRRSA
ncbi:MAG TPA: methionyl-tRNA formyltransferase [Thermoleophilaceae bacterium]|nr:methionyl-tRNA formyltransferase [Thermoleophilaceae bacterium]